LQEAIGKRDLDRQRERETETERERELTIKIPSNAELPNLFQITSKQKIVWVKN
jgi:hypothetical protein